MQGPENLLRKASVEKLSSPEQLDMMMRVTSPMGWVAVAAIGAIILAAIVWSVTFPMPVKVDGRGFMVRGEAVREVQILAGGTIQSMEVKTGDVIETGTVVARLSMPDVEARLISARELLAGLEQQTSSSGSQTASIQGRLRGQIARLEADRAQKQKLVDRGLLTSASVAAIDQQITSLQNSLAQSMIGTGDRGLRVEDKRLEVRELESRLANDAVVRSPFPGRVVAVRAGIGQSVRPGDALLSLESTQDPMRVIGFVPLAAGKKVLNGLDVRISPSFVRVEDYGFLLGKVISVSTLPLTPEEIQRIVANDALARQYIDLNPFQVVIEPLPAETPSGFRWTSSAGPPLEVGSGTDCTIQVVVETRKPISYVIPTVKKALGLS
ncbi:MAG: NHLP bacteriocin system secretion protein [Thermoanaerobaculia bacterium]|nr:NHLP bacteriocin system secretion protein [Thermoanaerobaculia bacterium]MBP9822893.1 NHLP bacteriocin system secretion protein [Thermoanaerobaculia bacterium]